MPNNPVNLFVLKVTPFLKGLIEASLLVEKTTNLKGIEFGFPMGEKTYNVRIRSGEISIKLNTTSAKELF